MQPDSDNWLVIESEIYEGVTETPHFPIRIAYEGCHVEHEDIYFDDLEKIALQLQELDTTRTGCVTFDGGSRTQLQLFCNPNGSLAIIFHAESMPPAFPGRLVLDGSYEIAGEHASEIIGNFRSLITAGRTFRVRGRVDARAESCDEASPPAPH